MSLLVKKFGGSSLANPARICYLAKNIAESRKEGHSLVVVVSAMGSTTDDLLALAFQTSADPNYREMDMLLTAGERISMALMSMALSDLGVPAISLTGSQTGIITDPHHRRARILRILGQRVRLALSENKVVIVAGFQGVSESCEVTTLGRGGSDTTAVALAASLGASLCEIYTDVDGVYSADPSILPEAYLWPSIRADLMVELANYGAGVLHPRSIELAKQTGVRIMVKNSFSQNPLRGTEIYPDSGVNSPSLARPELPLESYDVVGITYELEKVWMRLRLVDGVSSALIWNLATDLHSSCLSPQVREQWLSFFTDQDCLKLWQEKLAQYQKEGLIESFECLSEWIPLSVLGCRFAQDGAALGKVFEILQSAQIPIKEALSSSLVLTLVIPRSCFKEAVHSLHEYFFPSKASAVPGEV